MSIADDDLVKRLKFKEQKPETKLLKLDLGAGKGGNTPEGFTPVDLCKWKGVKVVDLRKRWPWKANSVDEVQLPLPGELPHRH